MGQFLIELPLQRRPLDRFPVALSVICTRLGSFLLPSPCVQLRNLETGQPLDHALRPVHHAPDQRRLGAHVVPVGVHSLDKLFAGVVRAVLVEGVVEIQDEGFDVFDLFWSLVDICVSNIARGNPARQIYMCRTIAHQANQFEVVEHQRLDQFLKLKAAVEVFAVSVYFRCGAQALDASVFEALEGFGELSREGLVEPIILCRGSTDSLRYAK